MSDELFDSYDEDELPYESGLSLLEYDGVVRVPSPVIGVVLSVNYSDQDSNLLRRVIAQGGDSDAKASYLEAEVLVLFSGYTQNYVLPNCILAQGNKTSRMGPTEDEPADFTEDIPNGCSAKQLQELRGGNQIPYEELEGDWVVVDFIGGSQELPVVRGWFPNPYNNTDTAVADDGRRFVLRRNNSEWKIDKKGDMHFTHRTGQYLQFKGREITLKSIAGQMIHLDSKGDVNVLDKRGNAITMDEDGVTLNTGNCLVSLIGDDVMIHAPNDTASVQAKEIDLFATRISATGGMGGNALLTENLLPVLENILDQIQSLSTSLVSYMEAQAIVAAASPAPTLATEMTATGKVIGAIATEVGKIQAGFEAEAKGGVAGEIYKYRTKVLEAD